MANCNITSTEETFTNVIFPECIRLLLFWKFIEHSWYCKGAKEFDFTKTEDFDQVRYLVCTCGIFWRLLVIFVNYFGRVKKLKLTNFLLVDAGQIKYLDVCISRESSDLVSRESESVRFSFCHILAPIFSYRKQTHSPAEIKE